MFITQRQKDHGAPQRSAMLNVAPTERKENMEHSYKHVAPPEQS